MRLPAAAKSDTAAVAEHQISAESINGRFDGLRRSIVGNDWMSALGRSRHWSVSHKRMLDEAKGHRNRCPLVRHF